MMPKGEKITISYSNRLLDQYTIENDNGMELFLYNIRLLNWVHSNKYNGNLAHEDEDNSKRIQLETV